MTGGLEFYVQLDIIFYRKGNHLRQQGYPLSLKFRSKEASHIQLTNLRIRQFPGVYIQSCGSFEIRVMNDDNLTILRLLYIQFNPVCSKLFRPHKGTHGIFRIVYRSPPVGSDLRCPDILNIQVIFSLIQPISKSDRQCQCQCHCCHSV